MSPPLGFVKLNVDAAARTNPGDLADGGIFRNDNGNAWKRGFRKVIVESDSLLVLNKNFARKIGEYPRMKMVQPEETTRDGSSALVF
ncbi:hypothetical protein EJ110_NYTH58309 [Nymphaea thermarum]|nr:hypothetical protein EJ110_NYTH58309 [Nymphaea thermarum]